MSEPAESPVSDDPLLQRFGACTDEVDPDLETALRACRDMGMRQVELYAFWGKHVVAMSPAELARTADLLRRYGMACSAIGSLCMKAVTLGGVRAGEVALDPAFRREMDVLRAEVAAARVLGAPIIRTFGFRRDDMVDMGNPSPRLPDGGPLPAEILEKVAEGLRLVAREAADAGLVVGLENVRSCWANSGVNTGAILRAVDHPALRSMWDPGNDYVSGGVPHTTGYAAVRPYVCHVHVKDARVVDHATGLIAWEAVGAGELDYVTQFAALRRDGFSGTLSMETHWHPRRDGGEPDRVADTRISFEGARRALQASRGRAAPAGG